MDITRSQFLRLCAGAGVGALALSQLGACDAADDRTPDAPPGNPDAPPADAPVDGPSVDAPAGNCQQNGTEVEIGSNHGHEMVVSAADLAAGTEKTYNIRGTSGHPHTVVVTDTMFTMLNQNMQVMVMSSTDAGHPHMVMIRCA